jgi:hypothetical protein
MLICDNFLEAIERLWNYLFGSPPPSSPSQPSSGIQIPAECDYLSMSQWQASDNAVGQLVRKYQQANNIWAQLSVDIGAFSGPKDIGGRSHRHPNPASGFQYKIELNIKRHYRTIFDTAICLIHELWHLRDADSFGFFPYEVASLTTKKEFVALAWEWELAAYRSQLAGAAFIYNSDPVKYYLCWQASVIIDKVLFPLNGGNLFLAKEEIKGNYLRSSLEADWQAKNTTPAAPAITSAFNAYRAAGNLVPVSQWGL